MRKILKNEQANERTNERASERIEQKFMNEILSKTREIEENPSNRQTPPTTIGCSGNFYKILGIAVNFILWEKNNIQKESNENVQKRRFPAYFRYFRPEKKFFLKNRARPYFDHYYYAFLNKESVKTNDEISRNDTAKF